jgi:hypothetical protein
MPFTTYSDETNRIVTAVASGSLTRQDAVDFLSEHWARLNPTWALLFDASGTTPDYSPDDILDFVDRTVNVVRPRHPRLAIVTGDEQTLRLARRYQVQCESQGCRTIDVFTSRSDAEAWLKLARRDA